MNEALQRSSSPFDTQYASKAISESPLHVHTHTYTHVGIMFSTNNSRREGEPLVNAMVQIRAAADYDFNQSVFLENKVYY